MDRILAIDYGDIRVGLALSDPLGITAQGLDTLVINGSDKNFYKGIRKLVNEFNIKKIVIGNPKNMDGTLSKKSEKISSLLPELEKMVDSVVLWDERLTTVSAYKTMRELNISQKSKNTYADKLAATYILEGYLSRIKNVGGKDD